MTSEDMPFKELIVYANDSKEYKFREGVLWFLKDNSAMLIQYPAENSNEKCKALFYTRNTIGFSYTEK